MLLEIAVGAREITVLETRRHLKIHRKEIKVHLTVCMYVCTLFLAVRHMQYTMRLYIFH